MKKKLFQFVILYHELVERENKKDEYNTTGLVEPKTVLASDEKVALLQIAKQIPDAVQDHLENVEILLRPF
jgi:hypothetical protein